MSTQSVLRIGTPVSVGYKGSEYFGGGDFNGTVEAIGYDWIVIRDRDGVPRTATAPKGDFRHLQITLRED